MKNKRVTVALMITVAELAACLNIHAAAPPRTQAWCDSVAQSGEPGTSGFACPGGQPYAEAICNDPSNPNIIFCEDFNYPNDFYAGADGTWGNSNWLNPGLTTRLQGFIYGISGRQINLATGYPLKPSGLMPSGSQTDHLWVANWDPTRGVLNNGGTMGRIREPGGNYANGTAPTTDLYIRFQYFVTANYTWPGDPRIDSYNYGTACQPYDNKILYIWPPEGLSNPTGASYDAGLHTQAGVYDPSQNARFADALAVRYGDASTGGSYKFAPLFSQAVSVPSFNNYGPFQSLTLRNPHDTTILGKVFRFDTNRWYTIEMRYRLSSRAAAMDGLVQVWIDGNKIYDFQNIDTCDAGDTSNPNYPPGDCTGVGAIYLGAYHNGLDCTAWNGQQIIDNFVISRTYIGPPQAGIANNLSPAKPLNLALR